MSLYPCSACAQRSPGKLAQVYWAWVRADGSRYAARQRLCMTCLAMHVVPVAVEAQNALVACPVCHAGTVDDMDPVYATIYMPGIERVDAEMALCGPCAVEVRKRAMVGAEPLTDRRGAVGGPEQAPQPITAADAWRALGLTPNGRGPELPE